MVFSGISRIDVFMYEMHKEIPASVSHNAEAGFWQIRILISGPPSMSAVLADTLRMRFVHGFLLFTSKDSKDQSRESKEQPLDRNPPPANAKPPDDAVMLIL